MLKLRTESLENAKSFVQHWDKIEQLRRELGVEMDVLLEPLHFLTATDATRRSCAVACWEDQDLVGLMYATEHTVWGIRTGYAIGGDFTGRGLLLAKPEYESAVITASIEQLAARGVHSLHLRLLPADPAATTVAGLKVQSFDGLIAGDRLMLAADFESFLGTLGKHTRRNLRNYLRKAAQAGIEFVPSLSRLEYQAGVERLNSTATFRADPLRLARDERILTFHSAARRLGLRSADGNLVALLCGFTQGSRFHLLTQLNDAAHEHLSLSMVLRGHTIEHLIATGHTQLQFMGGASLSFSRFCAPLQYRSIFIDKPRGLMALVKKLCAALIATLTSNRKGVPGVLKTLCSGYEAESELIARTALAPAALVFPRENAPSPPSWAPGAPQSANDGPSADSSLTTMGNAHAQKDLPPLGNHPFPPASGGRARMP